jgi:hypothetical protein
MVGVNVSDPNDVMLSIVVMADALADAPTLRKNTLHSFVINAFVSKLNTLIVIKQLHCVSFGNSMYADVRPSIVNDRF